MAIFLTRQRAQLHPGLGPLHLSPSWPCWTSFLSFLFQLNLTYSEGSPLATIINTFLPIHAPDHISQVYFDNIQYNIVETHTIVLYCHYSISASEILFFKYTFPGYYLLSKIISGSMISKGKVQALWSITQDLRDSAHLTFTHRLPVSVHCPWTPSYMSHPYSPLPSPGCTEILAILLSAKWLILLRLSSNALTSSGSLVFCIPYSPRFRCTSLVEHDLLSICLKYPPPNEGEMA